MRILKSASNSGYGGSNDSETTVIRDVGVFFETWWKLRRMVIGSKKSQESIKSLTVLKDRALDISRQCDTSRGRG